MITTDVDLAVGNHECWDTVWNPVRGCTPVSAGCENCTAARLAAHLSYTTAGYDSLVRWDGAGPAWTGMVKMESEKLCDPLLWRGDRRVLVCGMGDLFAPRVTDVFIGAVFMAMMCNERHTFYVATKYALQMEQWFGSHAGQSVMETAFESKREWPLPNICMGISAEDQVTLDDRAAHLITVPAASKFLLLEPLIGGVDLERVECPLMRGEPCALCCEENGATVCECIDGAYNVLQEGIDWVVVGCETGPRTRTRAMNSEWVREIRNQCEANRTPFFYKQSRDRRGVRISLPMLDGRQWLETPV